MRMRKSPFRLGIYSCCRNRQSVGCQLSSFAAPVTIHRPIETAPAPCRMPNIPSKNSIAFYTLKIAIIMNKNHINLLWNTHHCFIVVANSSLMITNARRNSFLELSRSDFLMFSVRALHNAEMFFRVPCEDDFSLHKFCHRWFLVLIVEHFFRPGWDKLVSKFPSLKN